MRTTASILAIVIAAVGFLQLSAADDEFFIVTAIIYSAFLIVSALYVLRGGALIYLAAAWGVYLGMSLAAYADVFVAVNEKPDDATIFTSIVLAVLPGVSIVGLILTFLAHRKENRS